MNDNLTHGPLSADFVLGLVILTPDELAAGYRAGFLDARGAVRVAERLLIGGTVIPGWVEESALLLSDDYERVADLIPQQSEREATGDDPLQVWLFLALADLWNKRHGVADPLGEIESLYADFDYPQEMDGFVRYLPAPEGREMGSAAIEARWRSYLDQRTEHYTHRQAS